MPCGLEFFKETAKASGMAAIWRCSTGTNPLTLRWGCLGCGTATAQHLAYKECAETKHQRFCQVLFDLQPQSERRQVTFPSMIGFAWH